MTDRPSIDTMRQAQKERGDQLRALVISWHEGKTFAEALADQTRAVVEGKLSFSDDWQMMANEIYVAFTSQPRMTAWDDESRQDESPRIVKP